MRLRTPNVLLPKSWVACFAVLLLAGVLPVSAAKIGDMAETDWRTQAVRFLTLSDPAVRYALAGTALLPGMPAVCLRTALPSCTSGAS